MHGRVLEASQVEYRPFGKPPLQREEMITLDYSHLTSVLWGVCKGQAWLDEVEAWQAQRGPKNK